MKKISIGIFIFCICLFYQNCTIYSINKDNLSLIKLYREGDYKAALTIASKRKDPLAIEIRGRIKLIHNESDMALKEFKLLKKVYTKKNSMFKNDQKLEEIDSIISYLELLHQSDKKVLIEAESKTKEPENKEKNIETSKSINEKIRQKY